MQKIGKNRLTSSKEKRNGSRTTDHSDLKGTFTIFPKSETSQLFFLRSNSRIGFVGAHLQVRELRIDSGKRLERG